MLEEPTELYLVIYIYKSDYTIIKKETVYKYKQINGLCGTKTMTNLIVSSALGTFWIYIKTDRHLTC